MIQRAADQQVQAVARLYVASTQASKHDAKLSKRSAFSAAVVSKQLGARRTHLLVVIAHDR